ncbi:MAG: response regulator [Anaerolineae bacterium]
MSTITREQVHEALSCLNDNVQLAQAELALRFPEVSALATLDERANRLRALLLQAIELLRPPRRFPFGSLESRSYDVLTLRYVESLGIKGIADELALGRRQVHRALSQAEESLAQILSSRVDAGASARGKPGKDSLSDELMRLASQPVPVDVQEVVQEALQLLKPLADQFRVRLAWSPTTGDLGFVLMDRAVLKQVLVQLLSATIQATNSEEVTVAAAAGETAFTVTLRFRANASDTQMTRLADAKRIASSQGIACECRLSPSEHSEVTLRLPRSKPISVLVVEDNAGAIELYQRYLSGSDWRVYSVCDPRLACDVARRNRPDIVVLDIMMPRLDGWSVLELLRNHPETANIPVVICSVVDDPELGRALGASAYLKKPLSRSELLATLRQCLHS